MIKVALAGSVTSSVVTLEKLIQHKFEIVAVFGYEPEKTKSVSGYRNMKSICEENNILYIPFTKINKEEHVKLLQQLQPDVFFVVGLSQLVSQEILDIPKLGCIGFHPTLLPKGRGRAPIAWLVLNENKGAANFFLMGEGADDGPVFVQEPFEVSDQDDANSIREKIVKAIGTGLDKWLPALKKGEWNPVMQDELKATYYGVRTPEDGWINWELSSFDIDRLIKSAGPPYPGAYTFCKEKKIIITRSNIESEYPIRGVVGRVLAVNQERGYLIQCGTGLLWINALDEAGNEMPLRVGQKLGYYTELEIHLLKKEMNELKKIIAL